MSFNIYATDFFDKELKRLSKKYPSVKEDYKALVNSLKEEPKQGQPLGKDCYKISMASGMNNKYVLSMGYNQIGRREINRICEKKVNGNIAFFNVGVQQNIR